MAPSARRADRCNGRALVLGGGGVLGFAWTVGALWAYEQHTGYDARDTDLVIGTSAGAIAAAFLGYGVPVAAMVRHQRGVPAPTDPRIAWDYDVDSGKAHPPRPRWRPGSPTLVLDGVRHPGRVRPLVALAGLLPKGRGTLVALQRMITEIGASSDSVGEWPLRPHPWVVATDYRSGARVVFGRDSDLPDVELAQAVVASCAIPSWYAPVEVGGRVLVDGGTSSNTSLDLLLPEVESGRITEVCVMAPMASTSTDHVRSPIARVERAVRRTLARHLLLDAQRLEAAGATVTLLMPVAADLQLFGVNSMNPRRRTAVLQSALRTVPVQLTHPQAHDAAVAKVDAGPEARS